jgi:predicted DNA-binding protein
MTETIFRHGDKDDELRVRLPHALKEDLEQLAGDLGVPTAQVVRGILAFGVDALWEHDAATVRRHLRLRPRSRRQQPLD